MDPCSADREIQDRERRIRANAALDPLDAELGEEARAQILNSDDLYDEAGLPR